MDRPSYLRRTVVGKFGWHSKIAGPAAVAVLLLLAALPAWAARVPVRDGQTVKLKIRNILTTDNVQKNDKIGFEVAESVMINGHVVIAKGALAQAKITDVKGAFKPRAKDAEVVFELLTVQAVDGQQLLLRSHSERPRKEGDAKDREIHEKSEIPGQITRVVGAEKGKEYEGYINGSYTVTTTDAVEAVPGVTTAAPAVTPGAPAAVTPAVPVTPLAATDMGVVPSSVAFGSIPDGAEIIIDGNRVGNTPSTLRLTPGHHTIEIRLAGYRTWSQVMMVDPESHPTVWAALVKQ